MKLINKLPQLVVTGISLYILWFLVRSTTMIQDIVNLIK